jgi:hypothetical protein
LEWSLEPAHLSIEHLDDSFQSRLGLSGRVGMRIAYGAAVQWRQWSLGVQQGHAAGRVDFGLLDATASRLNRLETSLEFRWQSPELLAGWRLQPAAGLGRLDLRYRPDVVHVVAGGQTVAVSLASEVRWTRHIAAELLHAMPGQTQLVLRAAWRAYTLDLAAPEGNETRSVQDVQAGLAFRVRPF